MDKLILMQDDITALMNWSIEHEAEVLSCPASLRALEIKLPEVSCSIKGIREGNELRLYVNQNGQSLGYCQSTMESVGHWVVTKDRTQADREDLQWLFNLYCVVMAVMAYGWKSSSSNKPEKHQKHKSTHKPSKKTKSKPAESITYIFRRNRKTISITPEGRHASPNGEFTVRGHYRHYASGKVVWIAEYKKGTGEKKSKTYKLGGKEKAAS